MERPNKIIMFGLVVLLAAIVISSFFGHSNIKAIQTNISMSQKNIDSALTDIKITKSALDAIRANIGEFNKYVDSVQSQVAVLNSNKAAAEAKSRMELEAMIKRSLTLEKKAILSDSLPPIKIQSL